MQFDIEISQVLEVHPKDINFKQTYSICALLHCIYLPIFCTFYSVFAARGYILISIMDTRPCRKVQVLQFVNFLALLIL